MGGTIPKASGYRPDIKEKSVWEVSLYLFIFSALDRGYDLLFWAFAAVASLQWQTVTWSSEPE